MDTDSSDESSSDYTTESSEDDGMEIAEIDGTKLQLPQGLCERKDIFLNVLSTETWNALSDLNKQHLQQFLPTFPDNDVEEKHTTLQKLFNCDTFRFNSPLEKFHEDLKGGYFRPDIANMRKIIRKAERKEAFYRYRKYRERLKHDVIASQKKLVNQISNLPPGVEPKVEKNQDPNLNYIVHRTKRRYFQVLSSIQSKTEDTYCSPDENYPEGPPVSLSRKQRRHLNSIRNNYTATSDVYISTMSTNRNTNTLDLEKYITPLRNPFYVTDDNYKYLITQHKRRKLQLRHCDDIDPEYNTKGITLTDIVNRTQLPYIKNLNTVVSPIKQHQQQSDNKLQQNKKKIKKVSASPMNLFGPTSSNSEIESDSDSYMDANPASKNKIKTNRTSISAKTVATTIVHSAAPPPPPQPPKVKLEPKKEIIEQTIKIEPQQQSLLKPTNSFTSYGKITPVTISDLEGIDMMDIPIDLDNSDIDILELNNKPELMQETHSNFLSLIRDIICSTNDHRMNYQTLEERLRAWQENPISPLNDWYSHHNWVNLLKSALNFLCGNCADQPDDFVPYMEFKTILEMYQWIGAGRDSDNLLASLCKYWLDHRNDGSVASKSAQINKEKEKEKEEMDVEVTDRSQTPPPPRCPTNWTVRKASPEEIRDFREQERKRYDNPHKAFTYRCNGYESVVGPLKGIYNPSVGNTKARGHTMLNADRPNFVTILSLVRDATARLPNGEGTRADICELLKSSQYISSTAPDNVLQSVVSGALDRMHTQFDPCVKYDPKRKIWIYLHRNRSEEDFERIHQQYQGVNKAKKAPSKKAASKPKPKVVKVDDKQQIQQQTQQTNKLLAKAKIEVATVASSSKQNSLLISNQEVKLQPADEKEINEALQAIVQNRVASPTVKSPKPTNKGLVKIISPTQGKSLIIPSSSSTAQIIKQVQERATPPKTQVAQVVTQQLLQSLQNKHKQSGATVMNHIVKTSEDDKGEVKQPTTQFIQSITPQQLQNIKNVTLVRGVAPNQELKLTASIPADQIQIKTQTTLTPAQQQHILQTIKQKILPQTTVLNPQQQQIILKQKAMHKQQLLGQQAKINLEATKQGLSTGQNPVVAKVLTNAAGQVISVESLLAHQKQHGSLPQGTTLRVSGTKAGQPTNIIQLTSASKQTSPMAQFTVGTQNNIILTSQPKLVVASPHHTTTSVTTTTLPPSSTLSTTLTTSIITKPTVARTVINKIQQPTTITAAKFPPKIAQQIINAKLITAAQSGASGDNQQKIVHPKFIMGQQNQMKLASGKNISLGTKPVTLANANTIRMVNAANLNLTHIGGKPVLLASKGTTIQNIQGQNVILQTQSNSSGTPLVLQNAVKGIPTTTTNISQQQNSGGANLNLINQQNVVLAPQLKVQTPQQVVFSSGGVKSAVTVSSNQSISQGQHIVLDGHQVRLQTSTASASNTQQRVVLASQGQGGQIVAQQILLPPGFQGTAINIKALQGVKVIPIAQAHTQGRGVQGRQVFARLMAPTVVKASGVQDKPVDPSITSND